MLAWLERNQFLALGLAGLLLLSGLFAREIARDTEPPALVFHDGGGVTTGAPIRVHVAGAVVAPGVYDLLGGDRVEDALALAGGPAEGANLDEINLARRLRDGEKILVPGARPRSVLAPGETIDINHATQAQLILLPGIGEAYSRRIVDSRLVDGPFEVIEDLLERRLVPVSTFDGIRELISVSAR